jgi:hypothetical protein
MVSVAGVCFCDYLFVSLFLGQNYMPLMSVRGTIICDIWRITYSTSVGPNFAAEGTNPSVRQKLFFSDQGLEIYSPNSHKYVTRT